MQMYFTLTVVQSYVDEVTYYQSAAWLKTMTTNYIWTTLRRCWIDVYVWSPDIIKHGAGKTFTANVFQSQATQLNIQTNQVPIEASNSMSIVERYHAPLC